ncbi:hypothetical protein ACN091_10585, partial [Aliarcobacter butzleri]|uniref:hypothetical protein n=1 Tax=Aliarcobacter butzleri TaxID=28197 RepID=UPI003AEE6076
ADLVSDVETLYAAGADYVTMSRLTDSNELFGVLEAIDGKALHERRAELDGRLKGRREVLA